MPLSALAWRPGGWLTGASCLFVLALHAAPALADTGSCSASTSNVVFGSQTVLSLTGATATGTVTYTCPPGHATGNNNWAVCASIGAGSNSASQSNRTMKSGGVSLSYNLYQDAAYSSPYTYLGNTVYTIPYSNTTGLAFSGPIYAKILSSPAGIPPGTYTDSYTAGSQAVVNPDGTPVTYSAAENCTGSTGINWYNTLVFTVTATVVASCTVSVTSMAFGSTPGPIPAAVDATAAVTALCTSTTPYAIGLDGGQHASGSQRRMQSAASNHVSYGLFTDAGHAQPWSSGASATTCTNGAGTCVLGTGTGSSQSIPIYGEVPPQASPAAGAYTDTVVVTLTY